MCVRLVKLQVYGGTHAHTHTPAAVVSQGHGQDLCHQLTGRGWVPVAPAPAMCTQGPVCSGAGRGGCFLACAPCPTPILSIHKAMCLWQVGGLKGVWGPQTAGLIPKAPAGFASPGEREKRCRRGSLCVDVLITSPTSPPPGRAPSREAILPVPSRVRRLPVSKGLARPLYPVAAHRAGATADSRPPEGGSAWFGEKGGREVHGRVRVLAASGRGVKRGISCGAVVPDSLPSARGSV